jgi:hypothetical protein
MIDWIPMEEWELVSNENFLINVMRSGSFELAVFIAHYENRVIKLNDDYGMTFWPTSPFKLTLQDNHYITHAAKINYPVVDEQQEVIDDKYEALLARVVAMEKAIKRKEATYMKIFKKKDRA